MIVKVTLAIVALVLYALTSLFICYFVMDPNPFSNSPISEIINNNLSIHMVIKTILPTLFLFDSKGAYASYFVGVIALLYLLPSLLRVFRPPLIDTSMSLMRACFDLLLFWVSLVVFIHSNLDTGEIDNLGALYCAIGCALIIFIVVVNNRN